MRQRITQTRLKEVIKYDPKTGEFTWLVKRRGPKTANNRAGSSAGSKYLVIAIDGRRYTASHLAWLYMTGTWPTKLIDHDNQNKLDNRWGNLRQATHSQNRANTGARRNSLTGIKGVVWSKKDRKWRMQFAAGEFRTWSLHSEADEAAAAYQKLALEHFGEYAPKEVVTPAKARNLNANSRTKRTNRERVRRWYAEHIGCHQKECAVAIGLSVAAVYRHIKDLRAEWQSTQNSILDLYKVVTE